ncbi:sugar phosphate isomerase/epimerase [Kribbella yunnanensis]|uniref:Sugar phosphate isomerase/epimerase n=1 Tax=Kribbella yunnanensis TaxID=190194 RepID=A0ABP4UTJ8_9ACTN
MSFAFSTLGCHGAPLDEVLKLALSNQITGLELRTAPDEFTHIGLSAAERRELRSRIEDAGLEILAVSSYVKLCAVEEQPLEAHLELAADLGARGVRVFPGDDPADETGAGEFRALDRVATAPKESRILLETHDSHSAGRKMAALLSLIDSNVAGHNVQVIWDSAHTWSHGETPAEAFAHLRPWLEFVQIKQSDSTQSYRPVAIEDGDFPIQDLLKALEGTDYPLSLEWETKWHPHLPSLEETLPAVARWLTPR